MNSAVGERKLAELTAKIAGLREEFTHWRSESSAGRPLEKHYSQIERITARLDTFTELLIRDLTDENILTRWQGIELSLLDVHHLWDFFRGKFAARYVPWLRDVLVVGDELVWACYAPAQAAAARSGQMDPNSVREPPLTYFGNDATPLAISRHSSYRASLYTDELAGELRSLPVPVTAVPWHQGAHVPDVLMLTHEAGHHVEDDFGLTPHLTAAVATSGIPPTRLTFWQDRLGEVFADIYGVLSAGAGYVTALADFLAAPPPVVAGQRAHARYPTTHLRVQLALATLAATCPTDSRATVLDEAWQTTHPDHDYAAYDADVPRVVESVLSYPYPAFGELRLPAVLSFASLSRETDIDAAQLLDGRRPLSGDPRALLAAASLAFYDDPAGYRKHSVAARTTDRVRAVQAQGTRFRSRSTSQPTLAAADRAAGASLYERLTDRHRLR
ncbi:hypothetical protein [Actinoplanes flavus]|uniref:Uncharacterized protein n=1 Tax=Actinoplanes flavus TaxID=2820290 RepID=A0ABS3UXE4_9ACTN|nr:hypothetical protein [Actinoplanes flavus]MBO3743234.1 hypothetical protein [Actinoplanes flavus]